MIKPQRYLPAILVCALLVATGAGCTKQLKRSRHLSRGNRAFQAQQYDQAEIEYLNVLKVAPEDPVAISRLATIYSEEGRVGRAFPFLMKACELVTNDMELHLKLGNIYLAAGKTKEARAEASLILDRVPRHPEAPVLLVATVTNRNDAEAVRQRLTKLSAQVGDTAPLQLASGFLYFRDGNTNAGAAAFQKAQSLDPKSSATYSALATLYLMQKDLKQAESAFKTAAELSPVRSSRRLSYADFMIASGNLGAGRQFLGEITKAAPDYVPAWLRQADLALAEKNYTNCASFLNQALSRDSGNYDALLLKGRLLLAQGRAAQALTELGRTVTVYERFPQVHYQLALAHLLNNDMAKALTSVNRAVTFNTNFAEAILLQARLNLRKGDPAAAVATLTRLVNRQPQIAQAHLLLAGAYLAQKSPADALSVYCRMMELFPKNPQVPMFTGMVLVQQKKLADARQAFEKSLERSADFLPALEQIINLDIVGKQYATALGRAQKQIEKDPKAALPHLLLAKVHMAQAMGFVQQEREKNPEAAKPKQLADVPAARGDVARAEKALQHAIELEPGLVPPYLMLAQLYVAANRHPQALERLTALLARTNDANSQVTALMQVGVIQEELKNFTVARDAYEKLLTVNSRFTPALNNLAYLYSERLGDNDKAYAMAEKARQLQPSEPHTADTLGWILYKRGEDTRALELLDEAAVALPAEPEVQFHLGLTHYMMGEEEPARVALQQAADSPRDFSGKAEAGRRLALLAMDVKAADAAARADLEKRLRDEPKDPVVAARLAAIYDRDGATDKAVKTYETVLKHNPQNAPVMLRLARLYSRLNNPQKALEVAKNAHALLPEDASISLIYGRLLYQQRDYKWALNLIQEAARELPNDPGLQYDLAWACYSAGRVPEAEAAMQDVLRAGAAFPKFDDVTRFVAMLAAAKDPAQTKAAAAQVQKILAADPDYIPAIMVSALLREQQGDFAGARQLYEKVLAADPLFAPATRQLAVLLVRHLDDGPKAYELAVKAREAFPDDPEVARVLGVLVCRRGDYSRAAQLLAQSAQKLTDDGELLYYFGIAQYQLSKTAVGQQKGVYRKESTNALQRALALNLPTKLAEDARRVFAELK
jgi:tetratricopeptide (TPR) repeat protein